MNLQQISKRRQQLNRDLFSIERPGTITLLLY
jgi:hypothetical protein